MKKIKILKDLLKNGEGKELDEFMNRFAKREDDKMFKKRKRILIKK